MKLGRPKDIQTPEILLKHFENYKKWAKENPIKVQDFVGKDGDMVYREKERPLTIDGFETWLFKNEITGDLSHYFANTEGRYSDFITICSRIRKEVRADQIEGGMAGIYNPSITQRLNGLTEKSEVTANINTFNADFGTAKE